MKYIKLPSAKDLSVCNSYFSWLHGLTLPPVWFTVIYSLLNDCSLVLNDRLANITGFCQYHCQYNNKNVSIETYSTMGVKIFHCFCDFFSTLSYLSTFWSLQALTVFRASQDLTKLWHLPTKNSLPMKGKVSFQQL